MEGLSTTGGVGDEGIGGAEGELGLSLLWLSVLPPDRHDRACNKTITKTVKQPHRGCSCLIIQHLTCIKLGGL